MTGNLEIIGLEEAREVIRAQLKKALRDTGMLAPCADEIVDVAIHATDEAMGAMKRVTASVAGHHDHDVQASFYAGQMLIVNCMMVCRALRDEIEQVVEFTAEEVTVQ